MDAYRNMIINRGADDMIFATKEKVKFTETVLRDAHQSLMATRMKLPGVLGRRHLRRVHALPQRGSLGTSEAAASEIQEDKAADAPERSEYLGIPSLS